MRLLICTQVVDKDDSILGFFHRWIEEFAKHCESVVVICLFDGRHSLPKNVQVYSLGKERKVSSAPVYAWRFLKRIWQLRNEYDSVFVHMNPEYVVLGGLLWRAWGKKIGLWYVHKSVTLRLRIAVIFANCIFTASKESFRIDTPKRKITGHGIDTDFFTPDASVPRGTHVLSVGRLTTSKRHDLVIEAAALRGWELRIAGEGPEHKRLKSLAHSLGARAHFLGGISQQQLRDEYRKAACLVHTSETGGLDKVVLEALACDCAIITTSDVFEDFPVHHVEANADAIAEALSHARDSFDRLKIIMEKHSLSSTVSKILAKYE